MMVSTVNEIQAKDLAGQLEKNGADAPRLLDVRESFELDICKLDGATHIPLAELQQRFSELDKQSKWVVYCHSGVRSKMAATFLKTNGFNVSNLVGGINAWANEVDENMARY